jgi:phage shock protein A
MSKHGIIGRVTQLARANVSAVIDSADDPRQVLDQLLGEYTANIAEAEQAIAQLLGSLRVAEHDQREDAAAARRWSKEAEAASQRADKLRATGDAIEADRFDDLARVAIERQMIAENDADSVQHTIAAQHESIGKLEYGLGEMRIRLLELERKLGPAAADRSRTRPPGATGVSPGADSSGDILDPVSEVARFEAKVRREEARVAGAGVGADADAPPTSPLDAQFAGLDDLSNAAEIEERLLALKAGRAMASAKAKVKAQAEAHDQPFR